MINMIASLTGKIIHKEPDGLVLELDGIGYEIFAPKTVVARLKAGETATIHTHEYMREDARELYGFGTRDELLFWKRLIGVSGVGPRTALLVMGLGSLDAIKRAVSASKIDYLSGAPGIGKKTAQKIILELKGKLEDSEAHGSDEVVDALVGLGYTRAEAKAVAGHAAGESTEDRIKAALKLLGRKR